MDRRTFLSTDPPGNSRLHRSVSAVPLVKLMTLLSDRRRKIDTLVNEALRLTPEARPAFLKKECGSDTALRQEVEIGLASAQWDAGILAAADSEESKITVGTRLAHYEVVAMLGAGGMGRVYLAEDTNLRRKVALKVIAPKLALDENALRRLEHEARAASALNHPNILTVYEFGQADKLHYIASEYVEGTTLRDKVGAGKLDLKIAIDVAIQIASALAAAHQSGIVHRDIKPDNVIIRNDGIVKVVDFGIAKLGGIWAGGSETKAVAATSSISLPGMVMGTANYMSPEQARGIEVDARTDIFSLGSVMYEMVTGREAFTGETTSDVIAEILKTEPVPAIEFAPDLPYEIERIISKAMRKERESRYQSVRDLLIDLQDFKKEAEFQAKLESDPGSRLPKRSSGARRATPIRGSGSAGLATGAAVALSRNPRRQWLWAAPILVLLAVTAGYLYERGVRQSPASHSRTLAVLPFRNLKQDPATDFLGFSLADEIISKLGYVSQLTVRPSSSVDKYRDQSIDIQKVAGDLHVNTLLTGSFIKDGDDLRITTQLIDVPSDKLLWRDIIDVKYDKLLTVQDRVAQQIIKQLELNLTPAESANLNREKPINSLAYEYYLRGLDLYSLNQFTAAIGMLEKATEIEPDYAPAWAHLGRAYTANASLQFGGRENYHNAQAAYEKALALDPALVDARIYMANLFTDTGRVEQAVPLLRSVLRDSPNNAEAHWELGYAYRFGGMLPESLDEAELARQIDPEVKINSSAINSYLYLGEYDKFLQSLPVNDSAYILFYRGFGEYYLDRRVQAQQDFDRAYDRDPSSLPAIIGKALSYSLQRENERGLELLKQTEARINERGVADPEGLYKVAQAYVVLGDKASALRVLGQSITGGFFCYPYFERDPLVRDLRGDAEFQMLMKQALHRYEQFKATFF